MKAIFFFVSWLVTLFIGLIVVSAIGGTDVAFITTMAAAAISLPFILIFCIAMHFYLKKKPSQSQLHRQTLLFHGIGSFITLALLIGGTGSEFVGSLSLIVLGYFTVDSLLFHVFINIRHQTEEGERMKLEEDILDSPLDIES